MDIYDAVASLYDEYGSMIGVFGVGIEIIDDKEYLLVYGRPLALARIPSNYMGYEVHKKPRLFRPRGIIIIPRMELETAPIWVEKYAKAYCSRLIKTPPNSPEFTSCVESMKKKMLSKFKGV